MSPSHDVAILGYGPVGAMCALQLADAGLRVVVVERLHDIFDIPRAVGIDGESMRSFQRLGMAEDVEAIVQPRREKEELYFTDSKRNKLFGMEMPEFGLTGWRDIAFFDQPELEALLREKIEARGDIDVRLGFEVSAVAQTADGASLDGELDGAPAHVSASWLIGCDGASSMVRGAIGSKWESLGYDQDWLVIDVVMHDDADLPETMMQICDPQRLTTYIPGRDPFRRWEFQVIDGDDRGAMCEPSTIAGLLEDWISPEHYTLRRAAVYQFHAATASAWRDGRILLAGDAAHQTPPFLGQGVNSGFRDAVNLGWKLPMVTRGEADAALLDTYQAERGPHSHDLVDRAVGIGQLMETLAAREAGLPDPYAGAEGRAAPPGGEIIPPIRAGVLAEAQIAHDSPVGRLLVQPRVRDAAGTEALLDAHLGHGFAVVGRTPADLDVDEDTGRILDALGARRVAIEGLTPARGVHDNLFEKHAAVVVRPDRLIFGVADRADDLGQLVRELAARLALRID